MISRGEVNRMVNVEQVTIKVKKKGWKWNSLRGFGECYIGRCEANCKIWKMVKGWEVGNIKRRNSDRKAVGEGYENVERRKSPLYLFQLSFL